MIKQICQGCKKEFNIQPSEKRRRNYCSLECKHKYLTLIKKCQECNGEFEIKNLDLNKFKRRLGGI